MNELDTTERESELVALTEHVADWRTDILQVQLSERAVSNVLLSGGASKNGHRYSEAALREAAALYNRKPVFLDHATNLTRPYDRSMRDLAGWITEASYADGRILGNIRLLDTEAGRTLLALMSSETPAVGMSHVILARRSADGALVEKIHDVISVDAVTFPATTTGFREQLASGETASEDVALRESLEEQLRELRSELTELTEERDRLQARCDELETDALRRELDRELAASGLPEFAVTESFRAQLQTAANADARNHLIAEHRDFILRCRQRAPCSRPRAPSCDAEAALTRQFVRAVKSRR
jgi:hypothetical protein